jgi:hypothetical protein
MEGEFGGGAPREDILARLKAWRNDLQAKPSYSRLAEPARGLGLGGGAGGGGGGSAGGGQSGENKCAVPPSPPGGGPATLDCVGHDTLRGAPAAAV